MPAEEQRRQALHRAASASWGQEVADTLVELVTPAGQDPATRADLDGVLVALDAMDERWSERFAAGDERWSERSAALEHRLTATFERGLREAITSQTRALVVSLSVSVVAIAGLDTRSRAVAVARRKGRWLDARRCINRSQWNVNTQGLNCGRTRST